MLTLTLGTTTAEIKRFTSYTPRIEITDQRPGFRHTINLNSLITHPPGEAKHLWTFSTIGDEEFYLQLTKLKAKQAKAIRAGTFTGIVLTDEIDKLVEFESTPTRQSVGTVGSGVDGSLTYFAEFLVGANIDFERDGKLYTASVTLTELGKLTP